MRLRRLADPADAFKPDRNHEDRNHEDHLPLAVGNICNSNLQSLPKLKKLNEINSP